MTQAQLKLLQGTLDVLVLKAMTFGARHGFGVAQWIRQTSDDALGIEDGALYTALHRLERRGLIVSEWGLSENNRKAKYYKLTRAGRAQLKSGTHAWTQYAEAVFKVLQSTVEAPA